MKIAIVGTAGSAKDAPVGEDWKIWSLPGNCNRWADKDSVDEWFELHEIPNLINSGIGKPEYLKILKDLSKKLTIIQPDSTLPEAKIYPRQEILNTHGDYFTSSIAWLLGLAIQNNPETIGIWGVNCSGSNEYAEQRACIEYLIGIARGKGIKIVIHPDSMLLKGFLYHDKHSQRITKKLKEMDEAADNTRNLANYQRGYSDALKFVKLGLGE